MQTIFEIINALWEPFLGNVHIFQEGTPYYAELFLEILLISTGFSLLFRKFGLPVWQAWIPGYRYYALARCGGHEAEGRTAFIYSVLWYLTAIIERFTSVGSAVDLFISITQTTLGLILTIYIVRIYLGVLKNLGLRKWWIVLIFVEEWAPILYFGLSGKIQPRWTLEDLEHRIDSFFSGSRAAVLSEGLTINLEERTVWNLFEKRYLLRDVHMYIKPGSMVLLLGGSGAGKTTLVNAINGYEKAKAQITLNGGDLYASYKSMQHQIGFVPQLDLMRMSDTVKNTLDDAAKMRLPIEFSAEDREKRVQEVMDIFGLTPVKNSLVEKLSGGQRKRLSIAMEFIPNPSLFILDEPDSGLDGVMARELMQQLRDIADQGKVIIVITHTPDRVIDLFDDVIVLAKDQRRTGRLAYYGPIKEAEAFFDREGMENIVKCINRKEEGGEGRADEFILKYAEAQPG